MEVKVLGSGVAIPHEKGVQSGYLVKKAGASPILVDCGSGVVYRIAQTDYSVLDLDTVLITHCHPDHITDLISLVQARRLQDKPELNVYGPKGTKNTVQNLLKALDLWENSSVEIIHLENNSHREINNYEVKTLETKHSATSFAYKIDNKLVLTGDTEKFDQLKNFLKGTKAIIHEASFPLENNVDNHSNPQDIVEMVQNSNAQLLILTHLYPQARKKIHTTLKYIQEKFPGIIKPAQDLETFTL